MTVQVTTSARPDSVSHRELAPPQWAQRGPGGLRRWSQVLQLQPTLAQRGPEGRGGWMIGGRRGAEQGAVHHAAPRMTEVLTGDGQM
jgi:hypothetical protein